ncbi:phosphate acyltransferase PlsX [Haliangium sp.]|uniref:phosphate acyltransferase PlsX n=1 Tax=Haliangium sp. TaxID=2663208 RepID=UPI003D0A258A
MRRCHVAVDAMGGDHAPGPEVAGAVAAVREAPIEITLVGDDARVRAELARLGATATPRLHVRHASQVVTMEDAPAQAYRSKRDSSMRVAFELVKEGLADAVLSAGNSGAVLGHALFVLGRLPGLDRPAIVTELPTPTGRLILCDVGANVEVKARTLAQFAVLGACYDRERHGHGRPRVAILSNGAEASKGTALTRAADALLRRTVRDPLVDFHYLGYVEGSDLFAGDADVVATDGFTGNVVLKVCEGMAEAVLRMAEVELARSARGRVGEALVRPALAELKRNIDYAETGGALLAGVSEVVLLCHGRSDVTAIKNGIKMSYDLVRTSLPVRLSEAIARHRGLWDEAPADAQAEPAES